MAKDKAVTHRSISLADLVKVHQWERDPDVKQYLGGPVPEVDAQKWAAQVMPQSRNAFSVVRSADDGLVGWTLFQHSSNHGWLLRVVIGKPFWHFEFGQQTAELALDNARERGFDKISALVHPAHTDSLALLRVLQFNDSGDTEHEWGVECQIWSKQLSMLKFKT